MKEISINEININPAAMFGKEWCLIAAGNEKNGFNTMTVAWGNSVQSGTDIRPMEK